MLKRAIIILLLIFLAMPAPAFAVFDISIEGNYKTISFGAMKLGEEKTVSRKGGYEHQFNFNSTNGRTWYFKAQLLMPFTSGAHTIPPENFQWIAEQVINGRGVLATTLSRPSSFASYPVLIYTSADTDNTGTDVQIRLKYKLKIPKNQVAGAYTGHIRFIIVEEL
jgi:hypothetical protein